MASIIDYRGKTPPKSEDGTWLVTAKVVKRGFIAEEPKEYIPTADYESWMRRGLPKLGDVLVTTEAPLGEVAAIRSTANIALAQRLILLRADPEVLNQDFLLYSMQSPIVQNQLRARATGTTVLGIKQSELRRVLLPVPSRSVQGAVARALRCFDDLIENNRRRIEILEEMARLLYREWFVHFRFPGHEDVELVDSELGPIPDGWRATQLGEVATWLSGGTPSTKNPDYWDGQVPWITSGSLTSFQLRTSERRLTEAGVANGSRLVPRDTTLFVVRGMSLAKEFRHGIADVPLAFGQDCKALIAIEDLDPLVLAYGVSARARSIQAMVEFASHGTGKLSTDRLKSIPFLIPDPKTQEKFATVASPMRELVSNLVSQNDVLRKSRDLLLPRLVSGELDVSDLHLDGVGA